MGQPGSRDERAAWGTLNRGRVVRAALELIDEKGLDALTMAALARRLRVGTMSLYRHVRDRDDLLDGVGELLNLEIPIPPPAAGDWRRRAELLLSELRAVALRHPHAFPLLELRATSTELAARREAEAVAILDDAPLTPSQRAVMARTLQSYVTGFVLAEIMGRREFPHEPRPDLAFRRGLRLILDAAG
jgi:AcrR family transcriptional regulator